MSILFWILVAHTLMWAASAVITNLFSPNLWSETTAGDKFIGYFAAEIQLFKALVLLVKLRKRIWAVRARNKNAGNKAGDD